jgi:glycosyltransferase involved in cell wall biosynthesis
VSVLVITPTYNEGESLPVVVQRLQAADLAVHLLVVDDHSPDGTGRIADDLAAVHDWIHVLHRPGKQGLGAAYKAGMAWGLARDYDVLVEMDADGSHAPEQLHRLLDRLADADNPVGLVIGSRWVPGGAVHNWPRHRELLSRGGNLYVRAALGLPSRDATAGFRAYRRETLPRIGYAQVSSQGYCFQVEMAWRAQRAGVGVAEVPIDFTERVQGTSKMDSAIVREALLKVTWWGVGGRLRQGRDYLSRWRRGGERTQ